jgi:sugar lactone lactonase YvrE
MAKLRRREFFKSVAVAAGGAALASSVPMAMAAEGGEYRLFVTKKLPRPRPAGKVEVVFTCPGGSSNGLDCSPEGLWTIDGAGSRTDTPGRCKVYLSSYDGKLLRELAPEGTGPSGITSDGKTLWIGSTYSREIIRVDAMTGETLEKHFTPGAGVIYRMTSDPEPRPDTFPQTVRPEGQARGRGRGRGPESGRAAAMTGAPAPGTGAHELKMREGKLWMVVPPARMVYRVDPATWQVEHVIPSVGNRPHGIDFDGNYFWEADTNLGAFFKRHIETGEVVDYIELAEGDPFPHGMGLHDGYLYWTSDVGNGKAPMCRIEINDGRATSRKS